MSYYVLKKLNDSRQLINISPEIFFRDQNADGYTRVERNAFAHPVRGSVEDTDIANTIFDWITYNKGAVVIKQLVLLIGEENFSKAL